MAAKKKTTKRKIIPWRKVEREFQIGQLSIRKIAEKFDISDTAIHKRAKKYAWERDLADVYQRGVTAGTIANDAGECLRVDDSGSDDKLLTDQQVDIAIQVGIQIVQKHRSFLATLDELAGEIEKRLKQAFEEDNKTFERTRKYSKKLPNALSWIKGLHESPTDILNKLTTIRKHIIALQRQAYNLDAKQEDAKGHKEIEGRIVQRMVKLKMVKVRRDRSAKCG